MRHHSAITRALLAATASAIAAAPAACASDSTSTLWLPAESSRSAILIAVDRATLDVSLRAYDLDTATAVVLPFGDAQDVELFALRFGGPLSEHRLAAGPLTTAARGLEIPRSDAPVLATSLRDGIATAWAPAELPASLAALRIEGSPCAAFRVTSHLLPDTFGEGITALVNLDADTALAVTSGGQFFQVTENNYQKISEIPPSTPHIAAAHDPDSGELWLLGADLSVVHGPLTGPFVPAPSIPTATTATIAKGHFSGGRGTDGFELFAITSSRELSHFTGGSWRMLRGLGTTTLDRARISVSWTAPETAIASGWDNELVIEYDRGTVREVHIPLEFQLGNPDAVFSTHYDEVLGATIGTRYGFVFTREADGWHNLPNPITDRRVSVVGPTNGGVVLGGQDGVLTQYYDSYGYCPSEQLSPFAIDHMVTLGRNLLLAPDEDGDPEKIIELVILRP